jgi:hypothetical protein
VDLVVLVEVAVVSVVEAPVLAAVVAVLVEEAHLLGEVVVLLEEVVVLVAEDRRDQEVEEAFQEHQAWVVLEEGLQVCLAEVGLEEAWVGAPETRVRLLRH